MHDSVNAVERIAQRVGVACGEIADRLFNVQPGRWTAYQRA
jgi:hypothetical protein